MLVYHSWEDFVSSVQAPVAISRHSALRGETDSCAFSARDTLTLSVRVPRVYCATAAKLKLYRDDDMSNHDLMMTLDAFLDDSDRYSIELRLAELCVGDQTPDSASGLFYYTIELDTPWGLLYTNSNGSVTPDRVNADCTQLLVYRGDYVLPERFRGRMMYQIFPDRFAVGNRAQYIQSYKTRPPKADSIEYRSERILNTDWDKGVPQYADKPGGDVANNMFFGGNLWGVIDRLDYLESLGVGIIYLCPIFEAASNHRYDTGDYLKVDPMLGGDEALDCLIREAKKRDILIILDGVFNHTGADSRYFNKFGHYPGAGAYNSKKSRYYKWYSFDEYPDKYRCWWGVKILPAVRSDEPSYRRFICGDDGVIRRYLRRGIDGWRLDVADELSDIFLDELRAAAKTESPDSAVFGEVWEDASNKVAYDKRRKYFRGGQLDSVMNYPLRDAVIDFILSRDSSKLTSTARTIYTHYPPEVGRMLMNFLGTHDTERILSILADVGIQNLSNADLAGYHLPADARKKAVQRLKIAWALLAAFPGLPCIYYGDETGMEGGRDPFNRMPLPKTAPEPELLDYYRGIGRLRITSQAFDKGELEFIPTHDVRQLLLVRSCQEETIAVAVNLTEREWEFELDTTPCPLISPDTTKVCGGIVCLPPYSIEYIRIDCLNGTKESQQSVKFHENWEINS